MIWVPLYDTTQGCSSYVIGDEVTGRAVVVDPLETVGVDNYLLTAQEWGLAISHILETHVHADHRSVARALAEAVGVEVGLSHRAPVTYPFRPLRDGDRLELGQVALEVWETPGHTEDSLSFLVYDRLRAPDPWMVLTGDSLFVGDVGRPDLAVATAQGAEAAAAQQYQSVRRLLSLPDYVEVHPAHYGASACGGLFMSKKPHSTIGYERKFNRLLQIDDVEAFVEQQLRLLKPPPEGAARIRSENLGLVVEA